MNISYVTNAGPGTASFRYRIQVPAVVMSQNKIPITIGPKADPDSTTVVFSKHWNSNDISYSQFCRLRGQKVVYDICDYHFEDELGWYYKAMVKNADLITVNSAAMRALVRKQTDKEVALVHDPVTVPPQDFKDGFPAKMVWYGNPQNLKGLDEVYDKESGIPLEIVAPNGATFPPEYRKPYITFCQWHPEVIQEVAQRNSIAFLPYRQGKEAKSANRIMEAIQSGLFVMADIFPAAKSIPGVWNLKKGVKEGVEYYLSGKAKADVEAGKEFIQKFYPQEVTKKWMQVLK